MKEAEQDCLRKLCGRRRLIAGVFAFQALFTLFHFYVVTLRPLTAVIIFTMVFMPLITAYQWWSWTRWNAKVRVYRKVLRLADEGREANGGLKLHKYEQLEAAMAEANQNSEWLAAYPQEKE